jgi:hypothetical protein
MPQRLRRAESLSAAGRWRLDAQQRFLVRRLGFALPHHPDRGQPEQAILNRSPTHRANSSGHGRIVGGGLRGIVAIKPEEIIDLCVSGPPVCATLMNDCRET